MSEHHLFTISGRVLRAMQSIAADRGDFRYYLHGIRVRRDEGSPSIVLEATDGEKLLRLRVVAQGEHAAFDVTFPRLKYSTDMTRVVLVDGKTIVLRSGDETVRVDALDSRYRDFDKVIPKAPSGAPAYYDAENMTAMLSAITAIWRTEFPVKEWKRQPPSVKIVQNGSKGALVTAAGLDLVGVIQPVGW